MKPEFITFTGVDDHTSFKGMAELSQLYPIEWGILFSPKRQGQGRYPALRSVGILLQIRESLPPMTLSAHLCGLAAREVIEHGVYVLDGWLEDHFSRAQINTADPAVRPAAIKEWADKLALRAILQCRGSFPFDRPEVDHLFDTSGGRGDAPLFWPASPDPTRLFGYAGGINPDNVAGVIATIAPTAGKYWIDMESGVRDENDRFSLAKCRAVCEAVYGAK